MFILGYSKNIYPVNVSETFTDLYLNVNTGMITEVIYNKTVSSFSMQMNYS